MNILSPTKTFGNVNPLYKGSPFINTCNYDGALGAFKNIILPGRTVATDKSMTDTNLFRFN